MDERDAAAGHGSGESKKSEPDPPPGRLASGRATPRDHPPPAPVAAGRGGPVRARHRGPARRDRRARPRRALDDRSALRDPRRAGGPEGRRGGGDRRRHLRRAQAALGVLAPDVREGAGGRGERQAAGDRLRRRVLRAVRRHRRRQPARAQHAARGQRHLQRHRGRQERRDEDLRRQGGAGLREGEGRQRAAPGGFFRRAATAAVLDRRAEDAVGGHGRGRDRQAGRPQQDEGRGRVDRLRRAARAPRLRAVLAGGEADLQARLVPRQDRGHRRGRARAAGPPPDVVAGGRDGRSGDPRQRHRHADARDPAA